MKNCPDGGHCNNEDMIEELTQALAALLWQHDHNKGTLCGMALQDARAALTRAQGNSTDNGGMICEDCRLPLRECQFSHWHSDDDEADTHPSAICPVCGREMEWERYDDETGEDIFHCLTEDCPVGDDVPIAREDAERDEAIMVRDAELLGENYGDGEPTVYNYAPNGIVAYDVDTPAGAADAHRAGYACVPLPGRQRVLGG